MIRNPVSVFHFNPTCELAIANGSSYYMPPARLRKFETDLDAIMGVLGNENDFVICEHLPAPEFINQFKMLGWKLPAYKTLEQLEAYLSSHPEISFNHKPWGHSPAEYNLFRCLHLDDQLWNENRKQLFERKTAVTFLQQFLNQNGLPSCIGSDINQQQIQSEEEIESLLAISHPLVLKAPLSSSGRGLLVIRRTKLNEANQQWIRGILAQQGYLIAEPWLNKQIDLSFQFEIEANGNVRYLGTSYFQTNTNGQYNGHYLNFHRNHQFPIKTEMIDRIGERLSEELANSAYTKFHMGILGIDALIYLDTDGQIKLHPCIEINPRYTMGYLSQRIETKIHPEAYGSFSINYWPQANYENFIEMQSANNPMEYTNGLLRKGFLSLTPANEQTKFGAYIELF
ncbi:hypothetical protein [Mangrovibacterium sp.]|uniref:hypothetical protein n=1 Tax=Mangrovibacterium sp. TaxID=1961364 RepID=UPI003565489D